MRDPRACYALSCLPVIDGRTRSSFGDEPGECSISPHTRPHRPPRPRAIPSSVCASPTKLAWRNAVFQSRADLRMSPTGRVRLLSPMFPDRLAAKPQGAAVEIEREVAEPQAAVAD